LDVEIAAGGDVPDRAVNTPREHVARRKRRRRQRARDKREDGEHK
jgi:hypothetical protein